ncbi:MAG: alpha-L-glutamate ligase-like protein [Deltaproteobacteria bacterium]|nr:alpha-L-glutamate ligase-like protein [Deltaproteobacteria bacterium]
MFPGFRFLRQRGLLGMNSRNADYIMVYNPRSAFPLADNKVQTKQLALKFGIPTPDLFYVVENHGSIARLHRILKNHRAFVVKPARGSGGSGILLIQDRTADGFITQSQRVLSKDAFNNHISAILSGVYSLEGLEDRVIIESLIHPDPIFNPVAYQGVPDERVLVYRGVPVMAMVRLPTRASDGKANLHRGAIGAGIDLGQGLTLSAVHKSRIISHHPDTGNPVAGIRIPHWEKILYLAALSKDMTGLQFLGADFILDRERGPVLLELNARPGLSIQMANQKGLGHRLDQTDRAAPEIFLNPESRVKWAQEAFQ